MEVTLPVRAQDLKHHTKNLAGLADRYLGQTSLLHVGLTDLADHVEEKENAYNYEFHQERLFGGYFLDRVHWRIQRFYDSCASGDDTKIDTEKIDFRDLQEQIERQEYHTKIPAWIKRLMAKKNTTRNHGDGTGSSGGGGTGEPQGQKRR